MVIIYVAILAIFAIVLVCCSTTKEGNGNNLKNIYGKNLKNVRVAE